MKNLWLIPAFAFSLTLPSFAQNNPEESGAKDPVKKTNNTPKPIEGQYIVVLKEKSVLGNNPKKSTNREEKVNLNKPVRDKVMTKVSEVKKRGNLQQSAIVAEYADVMSGFAAKLDKAQVEKLKKDPDVSGVYQDYEVLLDEFTIESVKAEEAQVTPCAISQAGGSVDGSAKTTWIWILDTGMDMDHPDLNVQTSTTFAKSFISGQAVEDGHGHGSHCAGIAAGKNNAYGTVGVSAGAKVVPVKVLSNEGSGSWSGLIAGLNHVAQYDIAGDVVSMSLGGYGYANCENANPTLRDAIRNLGNAGTWVVIAAGNDYADAAQNLPGCINGTRVLTVGAMDCIGGCAAYSNFSAAVVDWVAVGSSVYSSYKTGGYATLSGTSMATPVVAGILHSKNSAPVTAGSIVCKGITYKKAKR